jgi:uncharacterized protein YegJ (DUF2314 family)
MAKNQNKNDLSIRTYLENIGKISEEENVKILADYQAKTNHKYKRLDYVKSAIKVNDNGCIEHMWVWVLTVDETARTITGKLSNDPLHGDSIVKHGDMLTISFNDIESIIPHTHTTTNN